ncbi:MAG: lipoyl(octanoyl) transferase LipB [Planctomycetota bacterium]
MAGLHHDWGLRPYAEVHAWQQRVVAARVDGRIPNVLLTGEHPPVITLGRKTPDDGAYAADIPRVEVERGGEATFHGPGQLVAYPIVHLTQARKDLHAFQRDLEEIGLRVLAAFGLEGERRDGLTGVWVRGRKIQSLGIAVRRWVTWHGLAFNVATDLAAFRTFRPCGLTGDVMTSLADQLGRRVTVEEVTPHLVRIAGEVLPGGPFQRGDLPPDLQLSPLPSQPTAASRGRPPEPA